MAAGAGEDGRPEHVALDFFAAGFLNAFVADFADEHGHFGFGAEGGADFLNSVRGAAAIIMTGLEHVEIEEGLIIDAGARAAGGMNGDGVIEGVGLMDVAGHFGPGVALRSGIGIFRF